MKQMIFATGNSGKMKEIRMIMEDFLIHKEAVKILSMREAGIEIDICENGSTFEENALIKARAIANEVPESIVLADDSGLVVDYLNGEPGIYSARYLGENTSYAIKNKTILERLLGVPDEKRTARFVCAIAAVLPSGEEFTTTATIEGQIGYEELGENGFGYDPIFWVSEYQRSTAQLTDEEKNLISHRGKALRAMKVQLDEYYDMENKDENTDYQ